MLSLVECDDVLRVHTARRYRRRTGFAPVTSFATLGDLMAIAGPGGQVEIRRLRSPEPLLIETPGGRLEGRPGTPEPLLMLKLEAHVLDLALTECGVLFVATVRGLAAFRLVLP
ncbi:hypothetical protein ABGB17_08625 [Sphaerisporangium sp. B11E5]|uniref:hypothetical protein n=1 Tax=Sphaerisporangium sp. B11E5 TaxID=3153563 RepID=UPI00325C813B